MALQEDEGRLHDYESLPLVQAPLVHARARRSVQVIASESHESIARSQVCPKTARLWQKHRVAETACGVKQLCRETQKNARSMESKAGAEQNAGALEGGIFAENRRFLRVKWKTPRVGLLKKMESRLPRPGKPPMHCRR